MTELTCRFQAHLDGGVYDNQTHKFIARNSPEWHTVYLHRLSQGDVPAPPTSLPAQKGIEEIRAILKDQVRDHATGLRNIYTRGESPSEVASWYPKASEARAVQSMPASTLATLRKYAPMLCDESVVTGIDVRELADAVLRKHDPFLQFLNAIQAASKKHRDALDAITDKGELMVYDWLQGWPDV